MQTLPDFEPLTLAYLQAETLRMLDTETLREIQLHLGDYIEEYPHFSRNFRRVKLQTARILDERHRQPTLF